MSPLDRPTGLFSALRAAVVARLAAAEAFAEPNAVPVLDGGRLDIARSVDQMLRTRTAGLCLVVTIPRGDSGGGEGDSAQHLTATVTVMIYERPIDNWGQKGRRLSVEEAAEAIIATLGFSEGDEEDPAPGWAPSAAWTRFEFGGFRIALASTDLVAMEVTFTTSTHLRVATHDLPNSPE